MERKRKLLRNKFIKRAPELKKDNFLKDFETLLLQKKHNSNIVASTKEVSTEAVGFRGREMKKYILCFLNVTMSSKLIKLQWENI